nr:hypothetical protein [Candidatus Sigynarchaeota archaeon]
MITQFILPGTEPYFWSFIATFAGQSIIAAMLVKHTISKKGSEKISFGSGFGALFMVGLLIVREILTFLFDFVITRFDYMQYFIYPNAWYLKGIHLFSIVAPAAFLLGMDYQFFKFKFKGILSFALIGLGIVYFFYEVQNVYDYVLYDSFTMLFALVAYILIMVASIFMLVKNLSNPRCAILILIGSILYITKSLGSRYLSLMGPMIAFFVEAGFDLAGLALMAYGVIKQDITLEKY